MEDSRFLDWPFFSDGHRTLATEVEAWAATHLARGTHGDVDGACRDLARLMGDAGLFAHAVPEGGAKSFDVRSLCILRETLARHDPLADFVFAMQGLGTGSILTHGTEAQRARFLPKVRTGESLAAFALSEPAAGSDVAALTTQAMRTNSGWTLNGEKTWISNGGIAGHYVVFAREGSERGTRDISAFIVPADAPGLHIAERIEVIAPHPLARLRFENCMLSHDALLGEPGQGFKIAMQTLDIFRPTVGAAALGFARRALAESLSRAKIRPMFGRMLADLELIQVKLADMATAIDAAALLTYRAAWLRDTRGGRITREAAMAKLYATESAQRIIDECVQIFGGLGVASGNVPEGLYREIRALRIYEGASEVQKLIIGRSLLQDLAA